MKKHGQRMEILGMLALFVLAMASDGGALGIVPLLILASLSVGLILLGDMFTRPRRKRRRSAAGRQAGPVLTGPDLGRAA